MHLIQARNQLPYFNLPRIGPGINRDVGKVVRKWKATCKGEKGEKLDDFLKRVEECSGISGLSEQQMLEALTEIFKGTALAWVRQYKAEWATWKDFCTAV